MTVKLTEEGEVLFHDQAWQDKCKACSEEIGTVLEGMIGEKYDALTVVSAMATKFAEMVLNHRPAELPPEMAASGAMEAMRFHFTEMLSQDERMVN